MMNINKLSSRIIGAAIEVHKAVQYKGINLDCGYRLDVVLGSAESKKIYTFALFATLR